jgi:hypothetical protein
MALGLLLGFAFIGTRRKDFRNALSMILVLALLIAPTIMLSGCSGFSSASSSPKPQPPAPTNYVITVVGTCGSLTASTTVTVTVE